jgi:hypothetical protein
LHLQHPRFEGMNRAIRAVDRRSPIRTTIRISEAGDIHRVG